MDEVLAILAEKISEKETELSKLQSAFCFLKLQSAYDCIADLSAVFEPSEPAVEEVEVDDLGDDPVEETAAEADPIEALDEAERVIIDATEEYDEDLNKVEQPYT